MKRTDSCPGSFPDQRSEQQEIQDTRPRVSLPENASLLRKEVIQPHLPIRLPCYDFTPVIAPALGPFGTSGVNDFRGVTGGVYKARERIHRSMLTCDY